MTSEPDSVMVAVRGSEVVAFRMPVTGTARADMYLDLVQRGYVVHGVPIEEWQDWVE